MYQNAVLFPEVSNRETWLAYRQFADNDTGELINLQDGSGNAAFNFTLEIVEFSLPVSASGYGTPGWQFIDNNVPLITGTLSNYLSLVDPNTIQIRIPKSVMATLRAPRTYDVYLTITDKTDSEDCRQVFIGRLPVPYGGRNT